MTATASLLALLATVGCSSSDPDPLIEELGVIGDDPHEDDAGVSSDLAVALARAEASYATAIAARLQHGAVTEEVEEAVAAAFAPDLADAIVAALRSYDDELDVFRAPEELGPRVHEDLRVLERTDACVHLMSQVDATPLVIDAPARETTFVVLVRSPSEPDTATGSDWLIERLPEGAPEELREVSRC